MRSDWWPAPLAHIPAEKAWDNAHVIVAEVKRSSERLRSGCRRAFTALVPVDQVNDVKKALANLDHNVSTSGGPHPFYDKNRSFRPAFWLGAKGLPSNKFEALVLSWASHNTTVLQPDPGFLMTYGLVPRPSKDGIVYWDDPRVPRHGIVRVTPSVWDLQLGAHV